MPRHPRMHDRAQAGLQDVRNAGIDARHLVQPQDAVPVPLGIAAAERAVYRLHQLQVSCPVIPHAAIVGHRVMHEHVVHDGKTGMAPAYAPDLAVKLRVVADVVKSGIHAIQRRPVNTDSIEPAHRRIFFQLRLPMLLIGPQIHFRGSTQRRQQAHGGVRDFRVARRQRRKPVDAHFNSLSSIVTAGFSISALKFDWWFSLTVGKRFEAASAALILDVRFENFECVPPTEQRKKPLDQRICLRNLLQNTTCTARR